MFVGGKTTCISLLEHFYEADEGQILIDDIPVQNYDYKFYHQKVRSSTEKFLLSDCSLRSRSSVKSQCCTPDPFAITFSTV